MAFVKVAKTGEVPLGGLKKIEVAGREIVLANVGGTIFAIGDVCTHAQCSLSEGRLEGFEVECPCHGARFDVRTGEVKALPATEPERSYEVKVEGDDIFVQIG